MEAAQAEAVQEKPKGKGTPVLMPERMGEAEFKRHDWVVDAEVGVELKDLLDPAYWAHVSKDMEAGDHVEVRAEDSTWIAYLVVLFSERTYARVVLDRVITIKQAVSDQPPSVKHRIEWKGPHHRFCVIRISDSKQVYSGAKTKFDAETWMRQHERAAGG